MSGPFSDTSRPRSLWVMEPSATSARPRGMRTPLRRSAALFLPAALAILAATLLAVVLAGCGGSAPVPTPRPTPPQVSTPELAVAAVQAQTPLFDDFGPKRQDVVGQDHWWEALPLDGSTPPTGWTVKFTAGWGDCPSGCIDQHSWTWNVTSEGAVTFVSEDGSVLTEEVLAGLRRNAKGAGAGGRATAGPTCPVERPNDPACAPRMVAGAVLVVRDGTGKEVERVTTGASGLFRFVLAAGDYTLEPQPVEGLMGTAQPLPFTIADGELTWLDVAYDTGMR
jgi:hypothetical protein